MAHWADYRDFEARKPPALAERMNRPRVSPTTGFRSLRCASMCLWHRPTYTTEGRLSCSSITSSGYLADAARCLSEPSPIGSKSCSARKPKNLRLVSSISPSSPTTCICSSTLLRLLRLVTSSTGSRATPRGFFGRASRTFGRCPLCGPRRTSHPRRAASRKRRFRSTSKPRVPEPEGNEAAEGLQVQDAPNEGSGSRFMPDGWSASIRLQLVS